MAGEIFLSQFRVGVEGTYGAAVVPTRKLYLGPDSNLVPGGTNVIHELLAGTRSLNRASSPGVQEPSGSFSIPVESAEILELLSMGLDGSPIISTPATATSTRLHTHIGGVNALDSGTTQFMEGANPWQMAGTYVSDLRFTGAPGPGGENMLAGSLFGRSLTQTPLTGTVTDRTPIPYGGWECALAIDNVTGADNYGGTAIAAAESVTAWDIAVAENNPGRVYTAANTRSAQAVVLGQFGATGSLTFLASGARALTEYNDFVAGTQKRIRLTLGNNTILEGALKAFVTIDVQVIWTEFDLAGEEGGVRTYTASFSYIHDSSNGFASRVRAQSARATAF